MSTLLSNKELILKNNSYLIDYGYTEFGLETHDFEDQGIINWEQLDDLKNRHRILKRIIDISDCINESIDSSIFEDDL